MVTFMMKNHYLLLYASAMEEVINEWVLKKQKLGIKIHL